MSVEADFKGIFPDMLNLTMSAPEAAVDLDLYIRQSLSERMSLGELAIGDHLLGDVSQKLADGAQGMFLWVSLEIDDVCSQVCEEDALAVLQNLPETLTETFNRALGRILKQKKERIAREIFKWVCVARRPLLLDELQEALSVRVGTESSQRSHRIPHIARLPTWCANLVEVDELSRTVHLAHHTVRTFILDTSDIADKPTPMHCFHGELLDFETSVGELCLTYLNWNDFQTALVQLDTARGPMMPDPIDTMKTSLHNALGPKVIGAVGGLAALRSRRAGKHISLLKPQAKDALVLESHPFLPYAKEHWIYHNRLLARGSPLWASWCSMVSGTHHVTQIPWSTDEFANQSHSIVEWVVSHRHSAVAMVLLTYWIPCMEPLHYRCIHDTMMAIGGSELLEFYARWLARFARPPDALDRSMDRC
ncbi:hypothetical protein F4780DRAFT_216309 [Xylariomycetidae sp. FL0641]|nr:hypothetical protein F4780DRAFT_216309 [Xylariomycetidae sp. FL0641]